MSYDQYKSLCRKNVVRLGGKDRKYNIALNVVVDPRTRVAKGLHTGEYLLRAHQFERIIVRISAPICGKVHFSVP